MKTMVLIVTEKNSKSILGSCCTHDRQSVNAIMDILVKIENFCPVYKYLFNFNSSDPADVVQCLHC